MSRCPPIVSMYGVVEYVSWFFLVWVVVVAGVAVVQTQLPNITILQKWTLRLKEAK